MIDIFNKLFNKPAVWDVAVAINRSNSMPLDKNSIFPNYALAEAYASGNAVKINNALVDLAVLEESKRLEEGATGAADTAAANLAGVMFNNNAYPGQILAVVTESETSVYYIDASGNLKEVGGKVSTDQIKALGFYDKDETDQAIAKAVADADHAKAMIVDSVNTVDKTYTIGEETKAAEANVIYYVYVESAKGDDKYNEYMLIGDKLVLIGSTSTDLTNYYTKEEVDELVKDFITLDDVAFPNITVKQDGVEVPDAGENEVVVISSISANEHEITPVYAKAATAEYVDNAISAIVFPTVEVVKDKDAELEEDQTSISVIASIENPTDDGATHTLKYQTVELPTMARVDAIDEKVDAITIPNISIVDDTSAPDVNITVPNGENGEKTVLGLVSVLRDLSSDGHTLSEQRITVPTVDYLEKMIADVTGGESAGEVLSQLNAFKDQVATKVDTEQVVVRYNHPEHDSMNRNVTITGQSVSFYENVGATTVSLSMKNYGGDYEIGKAYNLMLPIKNDTVAVLSDITTAKTEITTYIDNALTWQNMEDLSE